MAEKHALALSDFHQHPQYSFLMTKTLRRVIYYWTGYWSFSAKELRDQPTEPALVFYLGCMTLLMVRGAIRLYRGNRAVALPYLIVLCFFPLTYYITNPLMDYRQVVEPEVVVLAVAGAFPWRRSRQTIA
jgi:hypothetical protein